MITKKMMAIGAIALGLLTTVSCGSDDDGGGTPPVETADATLVLAGIEPLEGDFIYEGWIIVNGTPISTGTFDATEEEYTFTTVASDLEAATRFVVSIEPVPDMDPDPAATKILSGAFDGTRANLTLDEVADFADIDGNFEVFTPSDEDDTNEENGLWFVTTNVDAMDGEEPFEAGLNLPDLAPGWKYEGWVVFEKDGVDVPVSTGTFTDINRFDEASIYSSDRLTPNFPGQDFLTSSFTSIDGMTTLTFPEDGNVTMPSGQTVVVSIEPDPDTDPAPFFVKPLNGNIGTEISPAPNQLFRNNLLLNGIGGTVTR